MSQEDCYNSVVYSFSKYKFAFIFVRGETQRAGYRVAQKVYEKIAKPKNDLITRISVETKTSTSLSKKSRKFTHKLWRKRENIFFSDIMRMEHHSLRHQFSQAFKTPRSRATNFLNVILYLMILWSAYLTKPFKFYRKTFIDVRSLGPHNYYHILKKHILRKNGFIYI